MVGGDGDQYARILQNPRCLKVHVLNLNFIARRQCWPDDRWESGLLDLTGDQMPLGTVVQR